MDDRNDDHYVYHDLNLYKHKTVIVEEEKNLWKFIPLYNYSSKRQQHYRNNAKTQNHL